MEARVSEFLRKEHTGDKLVKIVVSEGMDEIPMQAMVKINKQIFSEQGEPITALHEASFKKQLIDSLPQTARLCSLKTHEKGYLFFDVGEHTENSMAWDPLWYYIEVLGFSTYASELEGETVLAVEEVNGLQKQIIQCGIGEQVRTGCKVSFMYQLIDPTGQCLEAESYKQLLLTDPLRDSFHPGIQTILLSMRTQEHCKFTLPAASHRVATHTSQDLLCTITLTEVAFDYKAERPQDLPFLEVIELERGFVKHVVQKGTEPFTNEYEAWFTIEGRLDDGMVIQKPHPIVITESKFDKVPFDLLAVTKTFARKEISWVRVPPGQHTKVGFIHDAIWYLLTNTDFLPTRSLPQLKDLPFARRAECYQLLLEDANNLFRSGLSARATKVYNVANQHLSMSELELEKLTPEERVELTALSIRVLLNLSQCAILTMKQTPSACLKQRDLALRHLNKVIELDPDNLKALYRKSNLLIDKAEYSEARLIIEKLETLYPHQAEVKQIRKHLEKSDHSTRNAQRECYQRIFTNMQAEEAREQKRRAEQQREARRARLIREDGDEEEEEEAPVNMNELMEGVITDVSSGTIERAPH